MSKETTPKIGTIRFTDREKEAIAVAVESDFFKLLKRKYMPGRVNKIALALLASGMTERDMHIQQGRAMEAEAFLKEIEKIADEFNRKNLDPDTED